MRVKSGEAFTVGGLDKSNDGDHREKMDSRTIWEASAFTVLND